MSTTSLASTASRAGEQNPRFTSGSYLTNEPWRFLVGQNPNIGVREYSASLSEDILRYGYIFNDDIGTQQDRSTAPTKLTERGEDVSEDILPRLVRVRVIGQHEMISASTYDLRTYDAPLCMFNQYGQIGRLEKFYIDEVSVIQVYEQFVSEANVQAIPSVSMFLLPAEIEAELKEFSAGIDDGARPTADAIQIARMLSKVAVRHVPHPEITVDTDGELSFDMQLKDGRLVFAELGLDGQLDVGVYGPDSQMLEHNAEATCEYFRSIIES